jgi:hypothetical protein
MGAVMLDTEETYWKVREYVEEAKGIAWDTCHKIYILMDDEQVNLMREYGYGDSNDPNSLLTADMHGVPELTTIAMLWYKEACGLKFINAVYSDKSIGQDGFVDVVSQFEGNEDDEDEDL